MTEEPPVSRADLERVAPAEVRRAVREGRWTGNSKRLALGYEQANIAILPERHAFDFMRFCHRNPKPTSGLTRRPIGFIATARRSRT